MHPLSKGILFGFTTGVCLTYFQQNKKYRELQIRYYALKTQLIEQHYFRQ